jgi:hypothetical protein
MRRLLSILVGISVLALAAGATGGTPVRAVTSGARPASRADADALRFRPDAAKTLAESDALRAERSAPLPEPGTLLGDPDAYVIIGTGTSTGRYPIDRYYNYSTYEVIYLASEIATAGSITELAWEKGGGGDVGINYVTVYMKHTTDAVLASGNYSTSGYTQVYTGSWPNTSGTGWKAVTLNSPFNYNGSDNLQVLVVKAYEAYSGAYPTWRYTSTTPNYRARGGYSDTQQPVYLTQTYNRSNVRFDISASTVNDMGVVSVTVAPELVVGAATEVWARAQNFGTATQPAGVPVELEITGPNGYSYTESKATTVALAQGEYEDIQFTSWAGPNRMGNYTVGAWTELSGDENAANDGKQAPVFVYRWIEQFTGTTFPPEGWAVYNNDGGSAYWIRSTVYYRSAPASATCTWETSTLRNDDWLVTPQLGVAAGDLIAFWYRTSVVENDTLEVWISTTGNQVSDFTTRLDAFGIRTTNYAQRVINLDAYAGQKVYIAMVNKGLYQWTISVDDVTGPALYTAVDDMAAVSIDGVPFFAPGNSVLPVMATVRNLGAGAQPAGVPVTLEITGAGYSYDETKATTVALAPGETEQIAFTDWTAPPDPIPYLMTVTTELAGDERPENDAVGFELNLQSFTLAAFPPSGWSRTGYNSGEATWHRRTTDIVGEPGYHTPPASSGLWWDWNHQDEWLISPSFTVPPACSLRWWTCGYLGSTYGDHYYTKVSTDNGATWNVVYDLSAQSGDWNYWETPIEIGLDAYAGQTVRVAFHAEDPSSNDGLWYVWFVDDIEVFALAAPDAPVLVSPPDLATNQPTAGMLIWNEAARAAGYDVYLDVVDPPVTLVSSNQPGYTYEYDGLDNNRTYYWQVVARNGGGNTASGVWEFTTELGLVRDVGATAVLAPAGAVPLDAVVWPRVTVRNFGETPETFRVEVLIDGPADATWQQEEEVAALAVGETRTITFAAHSWTAAEIGDYTVTATTRLVGDANPGNDASGPHAFRVSEMIWPGGWVEVASAPGPVKDGGWLTFNGGNGLIYGGRGYKSLDFYSYDPMAGTNGTWATLPAVPAGDRPCNKGTQGTSDGGNYVYLAKGNNTFEFYRYDITGGSGWERLADVPPGTSGKKVKVSDLTYSDGYVYMLKGNKSDFMRFNTATLTWEPLPDAPAGAKAKWDKGSFVVTDDEGMVIYAHKARYHELWAFDIATQTWGTAALPGMPLIGRIGKSKKAKDGSGGAFYDGAIHALKGGNTQEFWKYDVAANAWTEHDTIPSVGSTSKKKRVKNGGDVASIGQYDAFFAFKGNKTMEFWRYVIPVAPAAKPLPTGVMAGETPAAQPFVKIGPNPLANGLATLRYALPAAGPASINVYDVSGRTVLSRSLVATRSGAVSLDLRSLSAGIYLVKVEAAGFTGTQKLVIQQ